MFLGPTYTANQLLGCETSTTWKVVVHAENPFGFAIATWYLRRGKCERCDQDEFVAGGSLEVA